jgi:hypothetical protein
MQQNYSDSKYKNQYILNKLNYSDTDTNDLRHGGMDL